MPAAYLLLLLPAAPPVACAPPVRFGCARAVCAPSGCGAHAHGWDRFCTSGCCAHQRTFCWCLPVLGSAPVTHLRATRSSYLRSVVRITCLLCAQRFTGSRTPAAPCRARCRSVAVYLLCTPRCTTGLFNAPAPGSFCAVSCTPAHRNTTCMPPATQTPPLSSTCRSAATFAVITRTPARAFPSTHLNMQYAPAVLPLPRTVSG